MLKYKQYQEDVAEDIKSTLSKAGCQPILFIGSGFSKRYAKAPNWEQLLKKLGSDCSTIIKEYGYYKQTIPDLIDIGSTFAEFYKEWAWGDGKDNFPKDFFQGNFPSSIFIKYAVTEILSGLGAHNGTYGSAELDSEIEALKSISPHAIITTNYDQMLEEIFPTFLKIIGQQILREPYLSIGEIFKIHGCITDPSSLVLTREDYNNFNNDKKYLSAKLLTYFVEHPLLFIGYAANDPNIKNVLYDISRMYRPELVLSPNIYILEWDENIDENSMPTKERVLLVGENVEVRIKSITASSFEWVFKAFGAHSTIEKVDLKILRSLMARTVNLIRRDIPSKNVNVNFQTLEHAIQSSETFGNLLGVTLLDNPVDVNAKYPYTPTMLGIKLGYKDFNGLNQIIKKLHRESGIDICAFDNCYHCKLKIGIAEKSFSRKYSDLAYDLLLKVKNGEHYSLPNDFLPISKKS